jgi:hypothetical protein
MKLSMIALLLLLSGVLTAQEQQPWNPTEPVITFDFYWEAATPQSYTITLHPSGRASYVSRNPTRPEAGSSQVQDPEYTLDFTVSPATSDRIFSLARAANYFQGSFNYKKHPVASTGKKTLTYADPVRHFQTTYDYTENKDVAEITRLLQGISNTIEHGRKIQFLRRFDKLGLEQELKGMEELQHNGYLVDVQIIAPILENIANDTAVLHIARERAQRLLASVNAQAR